MKKKVLALLMCGILAASSLIGCSNKKESDNAKTETQTEKKEDSDEKQKVTIAIGNGYKPFCYLDESEKPAGYEYEVFEKVAEKMSDKYDVEVVCDSWDNLFTGLETGKYDVVSHHLASNPQRAEKYNVSAESLMYFGEYRAIHKKGRTDITDLESLAGMNLANGDHDNMGKKFLAYNEEHQDNPIILQETVPSDESMIAGIENDLYDAYIAPVFDLQTRFLDKYPEADIEMSKVSVVDDDADCGTYALLKKGNDEFQKDFDAAIKAVRDTTLFRVVLHLLVVFTEQLFTTLVSSGGNRRLPLAALNNRDFVVWTGHFVSLLSVIDGWGGALPPHFGQKKAGDLF